MIKRNAYTLTAFAKNLALYRCPYLWGASGQIVAETSINEILEHESTSNAPSYNVSRILKFLAVLVAEGVNLHKARFFDCSGLVIYCLQNAYNKPLFYGDTTADGLFKLGTEIDLANVREGDLVFTATGKTKTHVGLYIGNGKVIECKGREFGTVESAVGKWGYAARYTWFEDFILTRKLKVKTKLMTGDDVLFLQKALCSHGFTCERDGIFGKATKAAVAKFQKAAKLIVTSYGVVGKKTAEALGISYATK